MLAKSGQILNIITSSYLNLALRLFVGGTFFFSAISKLPHHSEFVGIVKDYDLLPNALATAYANALPWVELFVGVYLLVGILIRPGALVSVLMGISFMVANITAIARSDAHCGNCFGDVWTLAPWQAVTIDVFLLAAAGIILFGGSRSRVFSLGKLISMSK